MPADHPLGLLCRLSPHEDKGGTLETGDCGKTLYLWLAAPDAQEKNRDGLPDGEAKRAAITDPAPPKRSLAFQRGVSIGAAGQICGKRRMNRYP